MSKGLRSYPKAERAAVIARRLIVASEYRGLGYWGAVDAGKAIQRKAAEAKANGGSKK